MRMRTWLPLVLLLSPALVLAEDEVKFKPVITPDAVRFVTAFSEDKQAATMIFDNFLASTRADNGMLPDTTIKTFTYCLEPEISKDAVVEHHVRGFFSTEGSASAALVIHAAGQTTLVKLEGYKGKGREKKKEGDSALQEQARKLAKEQGFEIGDPPSKSDDYIATFKTKAKPNTPIQVTVILLVDRLPGDSAQGALLTVDSIDFEISNK